MASKDLLTAANVVTLARLPIFIAFLWYLAQGRLALALGFFVAAWALDAVDGLLARWLKQETVLGSTLDKIIDRIILGLGILALIRLGYLPRSAILLLSKDFALLPVLTIHGARGESLAGAGLPGKVITVVQGVAVFWLLLQWPYPAVVIGAVAVAGAFVASRHLYHVAYRKRGIPGEQ